MFINYLITILLFKNPFNNSLMLLLPVKILVGKVKLLSVQTNFAPIELGMCFWYNFVYPPLLIFILFNKHSESA